jgi:hypothetical protein
MAAVIIWSLSTDGPMRILFSKPSRKLLTQFYYGLWRNSALSAAVLHKVSPSDLLSTSSKKFWLPVKICEGFVRNTLVDAHWRHSFHTVQYE